MPDLLTGTVTFLFTDIEGSTRLWQDYPEAMRGVLARHDELVRGAIEGRGGYVVKTTGDGFHSAFASPTDAIDAAVDVQRALDGEVWPIVDPVRVRIGIHSGPAEARDGDYYGTTVNKAARLMSVAHGGQIVVSGVVAELVDGHSVVLADLGEHSLRDLTRPERIHQVVAPGLVSEFPPLATLTNSPTNLPLQVTSFVGRDAEIAKTRDALLRSSVVTLSGTGGVGKTRLALQIAAEVLPRFPDGAWFCELAVVGDADAMAQVIATGVGCVQRPGMSLAQSIVEYLKPRELLLLLDNCEHLLDEAAEIVEAITHHCPGVTVLATSREPLEVDGERVIRVRSLETPPQGAAGVEQTPAVQLFCDRAADAGAELDWNAQQWDAVAEICRRVDGIPLAIELAAARAPSLQPAGIAARLDECFRLLTGRRRGKVERHQTLRATVEWSYQLLDEDDRRIFNRLAVLPGTFDAATAAAVAWFSEFDEWAVTDALTSLVNKSMLTAEAGLDGSPRYGMLETLRQYARERLDEAGETERGRLALADYFVGWARAVGFDYLGPDQKNALARARTDLDNLRAAVLWGLESGESQDRGIAIEILALLEAVMRDNPETGLEALASQAVAVLDDGAEQHRRSVLASAAYYYWELGSNDEARLLAQRALELPFEPSAVNPFEPYGAGAVIELAAGNTQCAMDIIEEGRAHLERAPRSITWASMLGGAASFQGIAGRADQARADAEEALQIARDVGCPTVIANALHGLCWGLLPTDPDGALAAAEEFLVLYHTDCAAAGAGPGVMGLAGGLHARLGHLDEALECFREACVLARDTGTRPQLASTFDWSLGSLLRTGRAEEAVVCIGALEDGTLHDVAAFRTNEPRIRALERARTMLDEDRFQQAYRKGAALPYDELAAYGIMAFAPRSQGDA